MFQAHILLPGQTDNVYDKAVEILNIGPARHIEDVTYYNNAEFNKPIEQNTKTDVVNTEDPEIKPKPAGSGSLLSYLWNIARLVDLMLVFTYDECARIGTNSVNTVELFANAIHDTRKVFLTTITEIRNTCLHFNMKFFDCVKSVTSVKLRNLKIEEQFILLMRGVYDIFDQFGKCGAQIAGPRDPGN